MSGYSSLFERLSAGVNQRVGWSREVSVVKSVADHLAKMLSTRVGSVQTLSDYGLPDLNNMNLSLHDALSQARVAIQRSIEAYEPRMSRVHVIPLPREEDQLRLSFSIEGVLEVGSVKRQVSFTACLNGSGHVQIS
jgi:type VI secretion system protein